jgi:hypothetical protein
VYGIGVPVMFWAFLRYFGISESWAVVEVVTVWGYAMFVWIPVSVRTIYLSCPFCFLKPTPFRSSASFLLPFFAGFYLV